MFKKILALLAFATVAFSASAQTTQNDTFRSFGFTLTQSLNEIGIMGVECRSLSDFDRKLSWKRNRMTYCQNNPDQDGTAPKIIFAWKDRDMSKTSYLGALGNTMLFWQTGNPDVSMDKGSMKCDVAKDFRDQSQMQGMLVDCLLTSKGVAYPLSFFFFYPKNEERTTQVISVIDWRAGSPETVEQVRRTIREIAGSVRTIAPTD